MNTRLDKCQDLIIYTYINCLFVISFNTYVDIHGQLDIH